MKAAAVLGLLLIIGCGGSSFASKPSRNTRKTIKWLDNGNPGVPICGSVLSSCVYSIEILDNTNGIVYTVSITSTQAVVSPGSDSYSIRTNGYDYQGNYIHSVYEAVP